MADLAILWGVCWGIWANAAPQPRAASSQLDQIVRISVLSLFKPAELRLRAAEGSVLVVELDGQKQTLTGAAQCAVLRAVDGQVELKYAAGTRRLRGDALHAHVEADASGEGSTLFWLEVPGKLHRQYSGSLEIRYRSVAGRPALEAVVSMPLETAVASVVQAESPPGAGIEALKAQAVAARSFLVARQTSHVGFDFCDTTHCQFLRSPPSTGSAATRATRATAGLVLTWRATGMEEGQARTLAAMYARSCGGRTRTLSEVGVRSNGYPYYAVHCVYCSRHPELWQRESGGQQLPAFQTESGRLAFNRVHGWAAIPGLTLKETDSVSAGLSVDHMSGLISGRGVGHGLGLCQLGATDMALHGAGFEQILAHYYPNTRLSAIPIS